jgi:hypothetical protein
LKRVGDKLAAWSKGGAHDDAMKRLRAQFGPVCGKLARLMDSGPRARRR